MAQVDEEASPPPPHDTQSEEVPLDAKKRKERKKPVTKP